MVAVGAALGVALSVRSSRRSAVLAMVAGFIGWLGGSLAVTGAQPVTDSVGSTAMVLATAVSDSAPGVAGPTQDLWRVELAVSAVDGIPCRARVVVWGDDDWAGIVRGERLTVTAQLDAAKGGASAIAWRPTISARDGPRGVDAAIAELRAGLRSATAGLPARLQPLTRGMVIGDDSGMSPEQRAQLAVAGLSHLTAVSGSHFAIVLVTVTAVLRLVVRSRRTVAVATSLAMGLLIALVFPEPSVVRAATMAAALCTALWWGRPAHALPALCAGVIAVSAVDPRLASEPGFAMSVAAVAAIALWAPALAARLQHSVPPLVAHPLAVCIAAQCAVLPVLALIGGGVGPWSVLANLAVGWCAAPVTLIGLAAVLVAPVCAPAATALATASGWCAWPVDAAARLASSLPGAELTVPPGPLGAAASAGGVAVLVMLTFATRVRLGGTALGGMLLLGVLVTVAVPRLTMAPVPGDWLVVACDVGQGDAMLLRTANHAAVVIDVGPPDGAGPECLKRYGVRRIDLLIITHPHADHEGALPKILADVPVAQAWVSPAEPDATIRELERSGVPVRVASDGDVAEFGDVQVMVLAPLGPPHGEDNTDLNDASVVTLATVQGVTVLGLGDLEHEGQLELARVLPPVVVDLVKVPHHGSDRQERALSELVSARVAVVNVGAENTYGHPAPDALAVWGERSGTVLRTDECGDVVITRGPALATACLRGMEN
jgi:competence protein ComEC